jgi:signal transduction histidine kinase
MEESPDTAEAATAPTAADDRQARVLLAGAIERRLADIESRWLDRVQEELVKSGKGVGPTELKNAIGDYLRALVNTIRGQSSIGAGGTAAWADVAREHAITRVQLGFDITELVQEFILLRRVMVGVTREEGLIPEGDQGDRLTDLIDAAIAQAVKSYTESRDAAARRAEAEHVGFITHELRNPLSTAIMAASRLRRRREIADLEGRTLDMLERGLDRVRRLIDQVLLTERFEAEEMECRPVDIDLGRIVGEATRAAELVAAEKGVALNARYDPDVVVHVDPGLASSALQNVVDNAVKFTDQGRVELYAETLPTHVRIYVRDNCDGLSPEELATIFEPFKRAHSGKAGTGLGLAIARRAIEAQGGEIGAESEAERGCCFWLTMPKARH